MYLYLYFSRVFYNHNSHFDFIVLFNLPRSQLVYSFLFNMKLLKFIALFCILFHISYGVVVPESRIIGGGIANILNFPYQVHMQLKSTEN
jgi:hypothetical protein